MFEITEAKKTEVWDYIQSLPKSGQPRWMSDMLFERLKALAWNDPDFWQAGLVHGVAFITLAELKTEDITLYLDFLDNFFEVLYKLATENKPTKPFNT